MSLKILVAEIDDEIKGSVHLFTAKSDAYRKRLVDMLDYPEIRMIVVNQRLRGKVLLKKK